MKCENLTEEDILAIIHAFLDQTYNHNEKGEFYYLNRTQSEAYIRSYVLAHYHSGYLYCTEGKEAFCVIKKNHENLKMWDLIKFTYKIIISFGFLLIAKISKIEETEELSIEEKYTLKNIPFYFVGMMIVKDEYQHKGYFRVMLEEVFEMAKKENRCVILNTDSMDKVNKYQHVGFKLVQTRKLEENNMRYDMKWEK